jgi:hypothetical protein
MESLFRAQAQPPGPDGVRRSRGVIVRNSYRELKDTSLVTWNQWVPGAIQRWRASDMVAEVRWPGVEMDVLFRALDSMDDIGKLLSLELSWAWLNEAREIPKAVFDAIQGRVGRYHPADGGWSGIWMDTNPPDSDHWIYRVFEEMRPDGHRIWHQPGGRSAKAENIEHLHPDYYQRMSNGKDPAWVAVYVDGKYGYVQDGKPVYPEYNDLVHCAKDDIVPTAGIPLIVGIDWGLTPAATLSQEVAGQWRVLDELVTEDMGAVRFAELLGKLLRQPQYRDLDQELWGDPAGDSRAQTDERTPFEILAAAGLHASPAPSNDPVLRREAVATRLSRLESGRPAFLLSPRCKVLRKGMAGGYRYRRLRVSGDERYEDKADKNNIYSHVNDAQQYAMLGAGEGYSVLGASRTALDDPAVRINIRSERNAATSNGYRRSSGAWQ